MPLPNAWVIVQPTWHRYTSAPEHQHKAMFYLFIAVGLVRRISFALYFGKWYVEFKNFNHLGSK